MRAWFHGLPIRRKLVAMTGASTAVALLIACGAFLAWDVIAFRAIIDRDVASQARIIGENSAPAMVFNDERAVGETIAALEIRPRIVMGCVYGVDGRLFATYHREQTGSCPPAPPRRQRFDWQYAESVTPINDSSSPIGTLFIQRDLGDVHERLVVGSAIVVGLVILCGLLALVIGGRLQRSIVEPMLQLADTARAVSEERDVQRRLVPRSDDEVGVVQRAFNDMLDRIAQRTTALSAANADLQREVEERKRVEAERTMLLARERDANRLKDEFLATLSHELRTPLNAVLGWTRVLRTASVPEATQVRALESIERNARSQARLIEDLLEVSRIVTGKLRLKVRPSDLAAIVDAAIEVTEPAAAAKRITVHTDIAARPAMTSGDPDRLQQVVWNLLSNAVKFTPAGGEMRVSLRRDRGFTLTVQDTGIGVDPAFVGHIFEPFRQADGSTSREHGGLGLGLAIVRQIVELHGGTVHAESEGRGKGARFEVHLPSELPIDSVSVRIEPPTAALPATPIDPHLLDGVRLLVVDDEPDALDLMRTTFESHGATVYASSSAREALGLLDRLVPDVIVSDIGMPSEDGLSLIRRVRARTAANGGAVPAVALTAYASPSDRIAILAAGFQAHVSKPWEPAEVVALVDRLTRAATQ